MEAVLSIPELLELILSGLDMKTLLLAMRVCKAWSHLINSSLPLQQALFFTTVVEPSIPTSGWDPLSEDSKKPTFNPLLAEKFGPCFFDFGPTYGFHRRAEAFYTLPWAAQPYRTIQLSHSRRLKKYYKVVKPNIDPHDLNHHEKDTTHLTRHIQETRQDRDRFTRVGASWRKMLVTQPMISQMGFIRWQTDYMNDETVFKTTGHQSPSGLRAGQLYDLVQYHAGHHPENTLWFRVIWGDGNIPLISEFWETHVKELLSQCGVIVDVWDDPLSSNDHKYNPYDPPDISQFDSVFRCKESEPLHMELQSFTSIFPHRLFDGFSTLIQISSYGDPKPKTWFGFDE